MTEYTDKHDLSNLKSSEGAELSRPSGKDLEGKKGQKFGSLSMRRHEEVERKKTCNHTTEGSTMLIQACPECIETRGRLGCLDQKFVEVVASLKNMKELGQASNETNQSLSEQITGLETTVEGLKTAAENSKQDSAKLIGLQQQVGTIRTTIDEFSDSQVCHFQTHEEKLSVLMNLIDEQSL